MTQLQSAEVSLTDGSIPGIAEWIVNSGSGNWGGKWWGDAGTVEFRGLVGAPTTLSSIDYVRRNRCPPPLPPPPLRDNLPIYNRYFKASRSVM